MSELSPDTKNRVTRTRHSIAERMKVVELYGQGLGSKRIAREMGIDDSLIRAWLRKYRTFGECALLPYWRCPKDTQTISIPANLENDDLFQHALIEYTRTLKSMASITRLYGLNYQAFRYQVIHHHPKLPRPRERQKLAKKAARREPGLFSYFISE